MWCGVGEVKGEGWMRNGGGAGWGCGGVRDGGKVQTGDEDGRGF